MKARVQEQVGNPAEFRGEAGGTGAAVLSGPHLLLLAGLNFLSLPAGSLLLNTPPTLDDSFIEGPRLK